MDKYEEVGLEAGRLPADLKHFGLQRQYAEYEVLRSGRDFTDALILIGAVCVVLGYIAGRLS